MGVASARAADGAHRSPALVTPAVRVRRPHPASTRCAQVKFTSSARHSTSASGLFASCIRSTSLYGRRRTPKPDRWSAPARGHRPVDQSSLKTGNFGGASDQYGAEAATGRARALQLADVGTFPRPDATHPECRAASTTRAVLRRDQSPIGRAHLRRHSGDWPCGGQRPGRGWAHVDPVWDTLERGPRLPVAERLRSRDKSPSRNWMETDAPLTWSR